ncbi:uncharacterized protein LOC131681568 isoform X2 [Topomyia yanbarensis]|uniref:uncharacterized protein LOC131681568 isoform X2 n=1 Tax=Topomyia yanbarensis TaxID=2498891 RepID=UPI00273B3C6F|nr:uncharacterized protein LOC131681568 isoform X2 [Topomyia yanbarensis]
MFVIEEVMLSDNNEVFSEEEYLMEEEGELPESKHKSTNDYAQAAIVPKKKVPIIRKPGEVVTPVYLRTAQSAEKASNAPRANWSKITSPAMRIPLKPSRTSAVAQLSDKDFLEDCKSDEQSDSDTNADLTPIIDNFKTKYKGEQLDRIEQKLDYIVTQLSQHDNVLKTLKRSIKELQASESKRESSSRPSNNESSKKSRKRLIMFPVADDNYLVRMEELVHADEEVRDDLIDLFNEAPATSVYEFLRKNTYSLFTHTSKYTWTGKPSNRDLTGPPSNVAQKLYIVELLIVCACERFPDTAREYIEKEFRRALRNFNDTKYVKWMKKAERANASILPDDVK